LRGLDSRIGIGVGVKEALFPTPFGTVQNVIMQAIVIIANTLVLIGVIGLARSGTAGESRLAKIGLRIAVLASALFLPFEVLVTVNEEQVYKANIVGASEGAAVRVPRRFVKDAKNRVKFDIEGRGCEVMPVFSSGQWAGQAEGTWQRLGSADLIFACGGGIMGHPGGIGAGVPDGVGLHLHPQHGVVDDRRVWQ